MKQPEIRHVPHALSLLERAIFVLRRNNRTALAEYYLGSLPFVLALLYFWSDMSRNPFAASYNAPAACGLTVLFIWMKIWHVRYCRRLRHALEGSAPRAWTRRRLLAVAARQTALHASAVVVLPLAAILALPLAWAYAFYQNLCVLEDGQTRSTRNLARRAMDQCLLWPGQNHLLLTIAVLFGLIVLLNLRMGLLLVPYLVKWLFGVDTIFTLSGAHMMNTTYLAILCAVTYLCIDPIVKAAYVMRCFHGAARFSGIDLRAALRPFLHAALVFFIFLAAFLPSAEGQDRLPQQTIDAQASIDLQSETQQLDRAIDATLKQRRYAWRLPVPEDDFRQAEKGWLGQSLAWLADLIRPVFKTIGGWIKKFFDWLADLLPDPDVKTPDTASNWARPIRLIVYLLGGGLVCLLLFGVVRWWRRRKAKPVLQRETVVEPTVDIDDHNVTADQLPVDGWLSLAEEFISDKAYRRAMRALYLSILAGLADQQRLVIARYKSNKDYVMELARRSHVEPELLRAFRWCVRHFERSWYGLHPVTPRQIDQFKQVRSTITGGSEIQP
ncbi:MAG: DUF4129 domain-containing protein [Desulfobacteraceae bacterium]|jgi:hypothetical protein